MKSACLFLLLAATASAADPLLFVYFKEPAEGEVKPMGGITTVVVGASAALVLVGTLFGRYLLDWAGKVF